MQNDPYDDGGSDISVTRLIDSPRIATLAKRHKNELEADASERLWALAGQAMHLLLERSNKDGVVEKRFHTTILGWDVSGQVDWLVGSRIEDWKWCSAWNAVFKSSHQKWEDQLNCLACLARLNGHEVNEVAINAIYRDWTASKAGDSKYPPIPAERIPFQVWPQEDALAYMTKRVELHQLAEEVLPLCSNEDRWQDKRTGAFRRCERYCSVARFCTQWEREKPNVG